jgi:hypothetical protein
MAGRDAGASVVRRTWRPDNVRLSDLETPFTCQACGMRGADIRPDFHWNKPAVAVMGLSMTRLPGLPTISALLLTATIVAIVSIAGAPKIPYDILRDFQPTMAALVALGAATLAYFAAMAKVTLDRKIAARQRAKERIGLYLRLISQLRRLQQDSYFIGDYLGERVMRANKDNTSRVEWSPEILALSDDFDEVEKAWQNIELLPAEVFDDLDYLRQVLATIKAVGKHNETISEVEYIEARTYVLKCNRLSERCSPISL